MASSRRGGPPDLKSTLGSLLRTTLDQASAVREVVEQQTRQRGGLIDQALTQRKRQAAFARLGEEVYRLARNGQIGELLLEPEIGMLIGEIEALDDDADEAAHFDTRPEAVSSASYRADATPKSEGEYRVWRPVIPEDAEIVDGADDNAPAEAVSAEPSRPTRGTRRSSGKGGGIHFATRDDIDNDDDLESYMHDDDVPDGD